MRCKMNNGYCVSYTSPPPAAEPLLKEKAKEKQTITKK
jgi:hypothetical protein